jgi:hypothetical protein
VESDLLTTLTKMASIFEHPLSLIYTVGKSLWVNGADIMKEISSATSAYGQGQYFDFGEHLGKALDEVFFKTTQSNDGQTTGLIKRPSDEHAYDFLSGLFSELLPTYDEQLLYNKIDGKGSMVWGPVQGLLKDFEKSGHVLDKHFWLSMHEV